MLPESLSLGQGTNVDVTQLAVLGEIWSLLQHEAIEQGGWGN